MRWLDGFAQQQLDLRASQIAAIQTEAAAEQRKAFVRAKILDCSGAARGVSGIWLLLAAAIDPRLKAIWIDQTPASLRAAFDNPLHRNLHEAVIPGFALRWDLEDIVKAIAPRKVIWTDPTDWMGVVRPLKGSYRCRPFEGPDEPYIQELLR